MDWADILTKIPKTLPNLEGVPAEVRHLYESDEQVGGFKFRGTEPLFNAMTGAKQDKARLQEKLASIEEKMQRYEKLGKFEELEDLAKKADEIRQVQAAANGQLDELRTTSQRRIAELEVTYQGKITTLSQALERVARDNLIESLIAGANLTEEGRQVIPQILPQYFKVELSEDHMPRVTVVGDDRKPRLNSNMDPMTPAQLIAELREKLPSLFRGAGRSGGGAVETGAAGAPANKKPSTWSPSQKTAYIREHGTAAYQQLVTAEAADLSKSIEQQYVQRRKAGA